MLVCADKIYFGKMATSGGGLYKIQVYDNCMFVFSEPKKLPADMGVCRPHFLCCSHRNIHFTKVSTTYQTCSDMIVVKTSVHTKVKVFPF